MIARALFTLPDFDKSLVHTIITQATPHQAPVVSADAEMAEFYARTNQLWANKHNVTPLSDVTVFSTGGGPRDFMVRTGLTTLDGVSENRNIGEWGRSGIGGKGAGRMFYNVELLDGMGMGERKITSLK